MNYHLEQYHHNHLYNHIRLYLYSKLSLLSCKQVYISMNHRTLQVACNLYCNSMHFHLDSK